jgi:hypothetical protein
MQRLSKRFPPGLKYLAVYDSTTFVRNTITEVIRTLAVDPLLWRRIRKRSPNKRREVDSPAAREVGVPKSTRMARALREPPYLGRNQAS